MTTAEWEPVGCRQRKIGHAYVPPQIEAHRYVSPVDSDIFVRVSAKKRIAVIPGDGIGKEEIPQALRVLEPVGADMVFTHYNWCAARYLDHNTTAPRHGYPVL